MHIHPESLEANKLGPQLQPAPFKYSLVSDDKARSLITELTTANPCGPQLLSLLFVTKSATRNLTAHTVKYLSKEISIKHMEQS